MTLRRLWGDGLPVGSRGAEASPAGDISRRRSENEEC